MSRKSQQLQNRLIAMLYESDWNKIITTLKKHLPVQMHLPKNLFGLMNNKQKEFLRKSKQLALKLYTPFEKKYRPT